MKANWDLVWTIVIASIIIATFAFIGRRITEKGKI